MSRLNKLILNQSKITEHIPTHSGYLVKCMGIQTYDSYAFINKAMPTHGGERLRFLSRCLRDKVWEKLDESVI